MVFIVRDRFGLHNLALVGILLVNPFKGAKHDVGPFVFATCALNADEETDGPSFGTFLLRAKATKVDREGDECSLPGEVWMIACIIFVKTGGDTIAIVGNVLVETALFAINPVG